MKRVLIIDDEPDFRTLARTAIEQMGLIVDEASDAVSGLRQCYEAWRNEAPYDLILLDLNLEPGWSGDDIAARLVELDPVPRIILCTGSTDDPILNYADAYGIDALLEKPFPLSQLREAIIRLLGLGMQHN